MVDAAGATGDSSREAGRKAGGSDPRGDDERGQEQPNHRITQSGKKGGRIALLAQGQNKGGDDRDIGVIDFGKDPAEHGQAEGDQHQTR